MKCGRKLWDSTSVELVNLVNRFHTASSLSSKKKHSSTSGGGGGGGGGGDRDDRSHACINVNKWFIVFVVQEEETFGWSQTAKTHKFKFY
jgi:hypothetical protein